VTPTSLLKPLLRDLAELALEAPSREKFRRSSLELVCRATSMDAGAMNHTAGSAVTVDSHGLSAEHLRPSLAAYMNEITPEEFSRGLQGGAVFDAQVFTARRRASLGVYTEYLVPGGIFGFCGRMWVNRHGCFWITLSRGGRGARYGERDLRMLEAVTPLMMIGEALHQRAPENGGCRDAQRRAWANDRGLTPTEYQVVELLERGLTNGEIATVLGRSPNTIRNQLAAVFRKLHVSTRSELVFVLANPDIGPHATPVKLTSLEQAVREARGSGAPFVAHAAAAQRSRGE
jgi:DNA-binding CsgD family transcriptional regulator